MREGAAGFRLRAHRNEIIIPGTRIQDRGKRKGAKAENDFGGRKLTLSLPPSEFLVRYAFPVSVLDFFSTETLRGPFFFSCQPFFSPHPRCSLKIPVCFSVRFFGRVSTESVQLLVFEPFLGGEPLSSGQVKHCYFIPKHGSKWDECRGYLK